MSFVVIGLNHSTAPLDLLEQVTIAADDLPKALHDLSLRPHLSEAVVLSTCNRTEIYVEAERFHGSFQDVRDFLAQMSFVPPERIGDSLYTFLDDQAVEHLFRVSAGVDSAVVGEHEILGQVKRAWQVAQEYDCVGPSLNAVFRSALEVGKRVRTETDISRHVASVSQAAIVLAESRTGLAGRHALLIGAGEMGSGMALSLADRGLASITVMSRTSGTADELAARIGADVRSIDALTDALVECDIAFTSTAAPTLILEADIIESVMQRRAGRPLLIVDVALPRDVDPGAGSIDGLDLCDLDVVGAFVAEGLESRSAELDDATAIIDAEVERYAELVGQKSVAPLITQFRSEAERLRVEELQRHGARLDELTDEQRKAVDDVTRAVINKLLHEPTVRLKESATSLRGDRLADALRELFDLS
ncbi:MAG: glutamyl-tRNA reductase [Actinomycetota bacterium]